MRLTSFVPQLGHVPDFLVLARTGYLIDSPKRDQNLKPPPATFRILPMQISSAAYPSSGHTEVDVSYGAVRMSYKETVWTQLFDGLEVSE